MTWRKQGLWQIIHDQLRDAVQLKSGKESPECCDPRLLER